MGKAKSKKKAVPLADTKGVESPPAAEAPNALPEQEQDAQKQDSVYHNAAVASLQAENSPNARRPSLPRTSKTAHSDNEGDAGSKSKDRNAPPPIGAIHKSELDQTKHVILSTNTKRGSPNTGGGAFHQALEDWWQTYEAASNRSKRAVSQDCIEDMYQKRGIRFLIRCEPFFSRNQQYYTEEPPTSKKVKNKVLRALRQEVVNRLSHMTPEQREYRERRFREARKSQQAADSYNVRFRGIVDNALKAVDTDATTTTPSAGDENTAITSPISQPKRLGAELKKAQEHLKLLGSLNLAAYATMPPPKAASGSNPPQQPRPAVAYMSTPPRKELQDVQDLFSSPGMGIGAAGDDNNYANSAGQRTPWQGVVASPTISPSKPMKKIRVPSLPPAPSPVVPMGSMTWTGVPRGSGGGDDDDLPPLIPSAVNWGTSDLVVRTSDSHQPPPPQQPHLPLQTHHLQNHYNDTAAATSLVSPEAVELPPPLLMEQSSTLDRFARFYNGDGDFDEQVDDDGDEDEAEVKAPALQFQPSVDLAKVFDIFDKVPESGSVSYLEDDSSDDDDDDDEDDDSGEDDGAAADDDGKMLPPLLMGQSSIFSLASHTDWASEGGKNAELQPRSSAPGADLLFLGDDEDDAVKDQHEPLSLSPFGAANKTPLFHSEPFGQEVSVMKRTPCKNSTDRQHGFFDINSIGAIFPPSPVRTHSLLKHAAGLSSPSRRVSHAGAWGPGNPRTSPRFRSHDVASGPSNPRTSPRVRSADVASAPSPPIRAAKKQKIDHQPKAAAAAPALSSPADLRHKLNTLNANLEQGLRQARDMELRNDNLWKKLVELQPGFRSGRRRVGTRNKKKRAAKREEAAVAEEQAANADEQSLGNDSGSDGDFVKKV